jgi:uncharacterized protein (DUF58 family)
MVVVIAQPKWTLGSYTETYQFDRQGRSSKLVEQIAAFYTPSRIYDLQILREGLSFSRGKQWKNFFIPDNRYHLQTVTIQVLDMDHGQRVICEYKIFDLYPNFHFLPRRLFREVQQLEASLNGFPSEVRKNKKRSFGLHPFYRLLYWLYRIASGARYRAQRRLTRAGWMVVLGIIGAMLMGSDTENTVIYQALPILIFMLFTAAVFSLFFRARFSATRLLPRFGSVGRPFYYRVMVKNLTAKPQSDLTLLENLADPRPSYREWKAAAMADNKKIRPFSASARRGHSLKMATVKPADVPAMTPKGEVEVRVELEPLRRGVLKFSSLTLARPDPFGLFRGFVRAPLPQTVLILPRRYPLPPVALPGAMKYQEGGVAMASSIGRSEEFVSLREYRRGDPYRHIHWRSWAKTGKPIVKEFEDEFFVRHALVLDTFTDDPRSEAFEEAVSVAASFASTLITQESLLDLLFVGSQAYCFTAGRGLAHADQMLEILASVRVCPDEPFGKLEHLVTQHATTVSGCICVLLAWDEPRRKLVEKLAAVGVPTMVLLIVEPGSKPDVSREQFGDIHILEAGRIEQGLAKL